MIKIKYIVLYNVVSIGIYLLFDMPINWVSEVVWNIILLITLKIFE